jgi:hypothetical protein
LFGIKRGYIFVVTIFIQMKKILLSAILMLSGVIAFPQKKNYDIGSYTVPGGWKEEKGAGCIPYSRVDGGTVAGVWEFYMNETSGSITTGGYFRREYRLNANGTYEFLTKTFSAYNPVIFLGRETGTWTVSGNKITIRPTQGKNEEWSKSASGRNMEWGTLVKTTARKLETVTYMFELKYLSGMEKACLVLTASGPTVRDGRESNDDNRPHQFTYSSGTPGKPLVDLPPGR